MCFTYSVQYITVGSEGCLPVFLIYFGLSLCLLTPYTPPSSVSSGENWGVAATCFDRSVDIFKGPCLTMCALYWQLARGSLYELLIEVCGWRVLCWATLHIHGLKWLLFFVSSTRLCFLFFFFFIKTLSHQLHKAGLWKRWVRYPRNSRDSSIRRGSNFGSVATVTDFVKPPWLTEGFILKSTSF